MTSAKDRTPQLQALLSEAGDSFRRGDLLRTQALLAKARAAAPDDPDIALDLGDTLNRLQRMDAARQQYADFLARHPSAAQVRLAYGLTLMGLGRWEDSAQEILRVTREIPEDLNARFNLGIAFARLGRYEEAVPQLERATRAQPPDPAVFTEMGNALLKTGKLPEAEKAFRQALTLDPDNVPALFSLGQCYERMGRSVEAQQAQERFFAASGSKEKYLDEKRLFRAAQSRSEILQREGKHPEALAALLAYRDSLAAFPPYQQELGIAYLRLGRVAEAIAAFEKAVAGDASLTQAHAQLAILYQQTGQIEKAMRERQFAARQRAQGPLPTETP